MDFFREPDGPVVGHIGKMRWKSVIYMGNFDWGAFNGHNF